MNEVYYCERIFKERKDTEEYIKDEELPDKITRYRFLLSRVVEWEGYTLDMLPNFKTKDKDLVRVHFPEDNNHIIIKCKLEEFDKVMELYYSSKVQVKLN